MYVKRFYLSIEMKGFFFMYLAPSLNKVIKVGLQKETDGVHLETALGYIRVYVQRKMICFQSIAEVSRSFQMTMALTQYGRRVRSK